MLRSNCLVAALRIMYTTWDCVGSRLKKFIFWQKTIAADATFTVVKVFARFTPV